VTDVGTVQRILTYLGEPTQAPRIGPAALLQNSVELPILCLRTMKTAEVQLPAG
jgi:hypothetical protein